MDLALDNLQWLIYHKTKQNQTKNGTAALEPSLSNYLRMTDGKQVDFQRAFARSKCTGARDVMVVVVGNGHGDTSSNPGRD